MSRPDPTIVEELRAGVRAGVEATRAERDQAVAQLTAAGYSEAWIAARLRLSQRTVGRIRERLREQEATRD